jgi:hypothetical protein
MIKEKTEDLSALLEKLSLIICDFDVLLFSRLWTHDYLTNNRKNLENPPSIFVNYRDGSTKTFTGDNEKKRMAEIAADQNIEYGYACYLLHNRTMLLHLSSFVKLFYGTINNYLSNGEKKDGLDLTEYYSQDWYPILYYLNVNASQYFLEDVKVLPLDNFSTLEWQSFKVEDDFQIKDYGYNEPAVLELFKTIKRWFQDKERLSL